MKRSPAALSRSPPSPRTASLTSGSCPRAPAPRKSTVGWNWMNSMSRSLRPGPQRGRDPVAGGDRRVGGHRVDLADPAGRQDDGACVHRADAPAGALTQHVQGDTGDGRRLAGADLGGNQVEDQGVLDDLDPGSARTAEISARSISAPWRRRRRGRSGCGGGRPPGSARGHPPGRGRTPHRER